MQIQSFKEILPHWELADSFTVIEAAALMAGFDPRSLGPGYEYFMCMETGVEDSDGIRDFERSLNFITDAINSGELVTENLTKEQYKIPERIVVLRSDLTNWIVAKSKNFRPAFFFPDDQDSGSPAGYIDRRHLRQLEAENVRLVEQVTELQRQLQEATAAAQRAPQEAAPTPQEATATPQQAAAARQDDDRPLATKERNTLLKLVIGMATAYHGYDPCAKRSGTAASIVSELARLEIGIEADTVRKYLKEAAETVMPADAIKQ